MLLIIPEAVVANANLNWKQRKRVFGWDKTGDHRTNMLLAIKFAKTFSPLLTVMDFISGSFYSALKSVIL